MPRRRGAQRGEQPGRVVVDRQHAVDGEQLGEQPGHHPPVLDRRRTRPTACAGCPRARGSGRRCRGRHRRRRRGPARRSAGSMPCTGAVEVRGRGDQSAGDDAVLEALARPVDVGEERLEGLDPLHDAGLDDLPLRPVDDPGDQVERERPLLARQRERDALVAEPAVTGRAAALEVLVGERLQRVVQSDRAAGRGTAGALEHLVPCQLTDRARDLVIVEEISHGMVYPISVSNTFLRPK